jgi:peptide-methionine (S)-S-oxide reductase
MTRLQALYDFVTTRILDRLRDPLLLALRLFIGWQFFVTGVGKVKNIDNVVAFFTQLGLPMPALTAHFVAWVELLGGALLFVGLATRLTALVLTINMSVAYLTADLPAVKHFFSSPDEFMQATPFPYLLISLFILAFGAGVFSLDYLLRRRLLARATPRVAVVAAATAVMMMSLPLLAAPPQKAVFAMGCFWCGESDMEKVPGVISVVSGYTGGSVPNPTYEEVSSGGTGHYESVEVTFDPAKVTYAHLLEAFWHNVDPLNANGQFCDSGSQYRAVIFYRDEAQRKAAEASKAGVARRFPNVVTQILPARPFFRAEEYHQDYYKKNPVRYNFYRFNCGRDARLKEVWGAEAHSH